MIAELIAAAVILAPVVLMGAAAAKIQAQRRQRHVEAAAEGPAIDEEIEAQLEAEATWDEVKAADHFVSINKAE